MLQCKCPNHWDGTARPGVGQQGYLPSIKFAWWWPDYVTTKQIFFPARTYLATYMLQPGMSPTHEKTNKPRLSSEYIWHREYSLGELHVRNCNGWGYKMNILRLQSVRASINRLSICCHARCERWQCWWRNELCSCWRHEWLSVDTVNEKQPNSLQLAFPQEQSPSPNSR